MSAAHELSQQTKARVKRIFAYYVPLTVFMVFLLLPILWTVLTSLKPSNEIITLELRYLPVEPTLEHYRNLFETLPFLAYFRNSMIVASGAAVVSLLLSTSAAYSVSRFRFRGRGMVMLLFLTLNMFPIVLLLIPLFVIFRNLGLLDTHLALIIAYSTYAIPFSCWMLTGFFNAIPSELEESGLVDGCTHTGAFVRITLPLAAPAMAAVLIYIFIYSWNEFVFAAIFTRSVDGRTLPVGLSTLIGQHTLDWGLLTAGGVVIAIPAVVLFMFIQKYMRAGLTAGAVKA